MSLLSIMQFLMVTASAAIALTTADGLAERAQPGWPDHPDLAPPIAIQPGTHVISGSTTGYFSDPYSIRLASPEIRVRMLALDPISGVFLGLAMSLTGLAGGIVLPLCLGGWAK